MNSSGQEAVKMHEQAFKTKPFQHQLEDVARLLDHPNFGLFSEMGTGKTKTVIDAACILSEYKVINLVLVISPAAVRSVWVNKEFGEVKRHSWVANRVLEYHKPMKLVWQDENPSLDWLVTNYEFIRREEHREDLIRLLQGRQVLMVLDESSFVKSRTAEQTKACIKVGRHAVRKIILNGTPISNSPLDLWSQMYFLDPTILPYRNFQHFRSEFAIMGGWQNKQVVKFKNLDKLQDLVAPHVVRRLKDDCLDLPEKIYLPPIEVPLSESTWKIYKEMRDDAVVWLDENPSMAAQAGVRIMRLCQLTSGFLGGFLPPDATNLTIEQLDELHKPKEISREKLDAFREWVQLRLSELPAAKIICWCRFRPELERVSDDLKDILPTYRLYGQSKAERVESVSKFSIVGEDKPALLAGQVQAGGLGLNLVAAHLVAYLSNDFNLAARLQSEDRIHRPGQTRNCLYQDFIATGPRGQKTIDHHVVIRLRNKLDLATWTCSAWRQLLIEE